MQLLVFRHLWGLEEPWEAHFSRIKAAGYDGIEMAAPVVKDPAHFIDAMQLHNFRCIPMIFTEGHSVTDHIRSFKKQLTDARVFQPVAVTCHSGQDGFSLDESRHFFAEALKIEADAGVAVAHETHRGRILFNPWVTAELLGHFPELKLCCDFSHWVCVCERLLTREVDIVQLCAKHTIHIHARVGYEQGPQVPDPRAREYLSHVQAHESWWMTIWEQQHKAQHKFTTITPEFGPPPYLHTLPHTNVPVADLWDICNWQSKRLRRMFGDIRRLPRE